MNCDVVIYINGKEYKVIKKEESSQELSSFTDIAEFIAQNWYNNQEGTQFLKTLYRSSKILDKSSVYNGKNIIGNSSLEYIKNLYPDIQEILEGIPEQDYNITLIDKAIINGDVFKGRVVGNATVTHVIRNKYDAENFAKTERIRYEASRVIDKDKIKDTYLERKYTDVLQAIKKSFSKKIKKRITEINPNFDEDITILDLINDFLNNKSEYQKIIESNGLKIDTFSKLSDFCRELQKQQVFSDENETGIARRFRALHYKREELGKADVYETILQLGDERQREIISRISEQQFINMSLEEMQELFDELFVDDPIMSRYKVTKVQETEEELFTLKKNQISALIKKRNSELPKDKQVKEETLITKDGIDEFFENSIQYTTKDKITYKIDVKQDGDKIVYYYYAKKINNNDKIFLKKYGRTLRDEFGFGYDTKELIQPVNDSNEDSLGIVTDGKYMSYYIYEYKPNDKQTLYIISKSRVHPNLYDTPRFVSLSDAKLAIQGFIRSANIYNEADIEIKKYIQNGDQGTRSVTLQHPVTQGSTISSIQFPIKSTTRLNTQELNLAKTEKLAGIQDFYKKYGMDLSSLNTPEKMGIFLYAATEAGITIEALEQQLEEQGTLEADEHNQLERSRILVKQIINNINDAPVVDYLVTSWFQKENSKTKKKEGYVAYLKSIRDSEINSMGFVPGPKNSLQPVETYVKTKSLFDLEQHLNNTLFKDSAIQIKTINMDQAKLLQNDLGDKLFPDEEFLAKVKGFVHNNNIYIIVDNADTDDLIHETFHILFGAIRAYNPNIYYELIEHFYSDVSKSYKDYVDENYEFLAQIDRREEAVVRSIATSLNNSVRFFDTRNVTELDKFFMKQFTSLSGEIKKVITKSNNGTDMDFPTTINQIIRNEDALTKMQKNRLITNAIKKGIENGDILKSSEDC